MNPFIIISCSCDCSIKFVCEFIPVAVDLANFEEIKLAKCSFSPE
jgi:hypothetical protein